MIQEAECLQDHVLWVPVQEVEEGHEELEEVVEGQRQEGAAMAAATPRLTSGTHASMY